MQHPFECIILESTHHILGGRIRQIRRLATAVASFRLVRIQFRLGFGTLGAIIGYMSAQRRNGTETDSA